MGKDTPILELVEVATDATQTDSEIESIELDVLRLMEYGLYP